MVEDNQFLKGLRNLEGLKKPSSIKPGKTYRVELSLAGAKLAYSVNGRTKWKGKDPAPLTHGHASLGTWGAAVFDEVRIVGRPAKGWLVEKGLAK